jgi:hypothetical protein
MEFFGKTRAASELFPDPLGPMSIVRQNSGIEMRIFGSVISRLEFG